jgi:hypothetical protein
MSYNTKKKTGINSLNYTRVCTLNLQSKSVNFILEFWPQTDLYTDNYLSFLN